MGLKASRHRSSMQHSLTVARLFATIIACLIVSYSGSARADDQFFRIRSTVSAENTSWCVDLSGALYKEQTKFAIWNCAGQPNQVFGFESNSNLTMGGFCVDGLAGGTGDQKERKSVGIAECKGSDRQVWQMRRVAGSGDRVEIANMDGLCMTVDTAVKRSAPLVLTECKQAATQEFFLDPAERPIAINGVGGYGPFGEVEYYWFGGQRYCWEDAGWRDGGWYVCGESQHQGAGWGGPAGWNFWHHHGHLVVDRIVHSSFAGGGPQREEPHAQAASFQIVADQPSTVTGAQLCLAVDTKRPISPDASVQVRPVAQGAKPFSISGTFYPVIVVRCDRPGSGMATKWTATDDHEWKILVSGAPMCLSSRLPVSFAPLVQPFLRAFQTSGHDSNFAYLANDLDANNPAQIVANPELLVSQCGRPEASDFFGYDKTNGAISAPDQLCITIHGDTTSKPARFDAGMPVRIQACRDIRSFYRWDYPSEMRWTIGSGDETAPNFFPRDRADYFSGADGLPIVGPMGRCLTADFPLKIAVTSDCDGRVEQDWKRDGLMLRLGNRSDCLTRNADGTVGLGVCAKTSNQQWRYRIKEPVPNAKWLNADVFAQIHPQDNEAECLVVGADPFPDAVRQRNPVKVAACGSVLPRQTDWFEKTTVHTLRLAYLRYANDDGSHASQGRQTDEESKRMMESVAGYLSDYYRVLGLRFVFDPDHDYLKANDTLANEAKWYGHNELEGGSHSTKIASTTFYGKATLTSMAGYHGGGSSGGVAEFELDRMRELISKNPETNYFQVTPMPIAKDGLPAVSYGVSINRVGDSWSSMITIAHEFGHFFGLGHTFGPDEFGDTPDDVNDGREWELHGSNTCGNLRTITLDGKRITPERTNNIGYIKCMIGRARPSFTPMQLGLMTWMLNNQLNRYPMVACQPTRSYDANRVECENDESLTLCLQTADYLRKSGSPNLQCIRGGRYTRAITEALQFPAVLDLLNNAPAGRRLMNKLAGSPAQDSQLKPEAADAVLKALRDGQNLPVTMAVVNRLNEFREQAEHTPSLAASGFTIGGHAPSAADSKSIGTLAQNIFKRGFIERVPSISAR